jgi:hypothetical protein
MKSLREVPPNIFEVQTKPKLGRDVSEEARLDSVDGLDTASTRQASNVSVQVSCHRKPELQS